MLKKISLILLSVFFISSSCTYNFLYPENNQYHVLNYILSLLTLLSLFFTAAVFSKSKRFLIISSAYFSMVLAFITAAIIFNDDSFVMMIFLIIALPFEILMVPFEIDGLLEALNISNDVEFFVIFAIIMLLFYGTYFISRRVKDKSSEV